MGLKDPLPEIVAAREALDAAEAEFDRVVAEAQIGCPHELVAQAETHPSSSGMFPPCGPIRICFKCRREEQSRAYSEPYSWKNEWGDEETHLGNAKDRVIVGMSRDDIFRLRP